MNRREALRSGLGIFAASLGAIAIGIDPPNDGLPDELHAADYRQYFRAHEDVEVLFDGLRLEACVVANRAQGWADVIDFHVVDFDQVGITRRHGRVEFRRVCVPNLPEPQGGQKWHA